MSKKTPDLDTTGAETGPIDTRFLDSLLGYNARRAALVIIDLFLKQMAVHELRPVSFSVLSLIHHNPGLTSRQLCTALGLLPPNLVALLNTLVKRALVERRPHPRDGRALALYLTPAGRAMMQAAEKSAAQLELKATAGLSPAERKTLLKLLKKVYE
jgi:DNA-binding MarR family transcriptional regulator